MNVLITMREFTTLHWLQKKCIHHYRKPQGKRLGTDMEKVLKWIFVDMICEDVKWIQLTHNRVQWQGFVIQ
jgi:hypothetical protein